MLASRVGCRALCQGTLASSTVPRIAGPTTTLGLRCYSKTPEVRPAPILKATKITVTQGHEILTNQRLNRPIAPHLKVYRLSQTYFGSSAWMRLTGSTILGVGYLYFSGYLLLPLVGIDIGSANLVSAFAGLPVVVKSGVKLALAWPFTFHFCNGIKQLIYDSGWGYPYNKITMSRNDVYVFVVSTVLALGITFGL